jgi:hypothetical protein
MSPTPSSKPEHSSCISHLTQNTVMRSGLLAGGTLPLPKDVLRKRWRCGCPDGAILSSPRFRHFLSCQMYTVCQACHIEGSYTAVALVAMEGDDAKKLGLTLDVWRELGCAMDESDQAGSVMPYPPPHWQMYNRTGSGGCSLPIVNAFNG